MLNIKNMRRYFYLAFSAAAGLLFFTVCAHAQQLKLGNHPTYINPSAVLQLDSRNQGLLLTRVPDTGAMTSLNPPDGMIIYFTDSSTTTHISPGPNAGVYERKNDQWQLLTGITSLNGSTVPVQTFDTGRAGSNFNIITNTATGQHTFNLPDASPTTRGVINTRVQTIGGVKTINSGSANTSGLAFTNLNSSSPVSSSNTGLLGVDGSGNVVRADVQRNFQYPTQPINSSFQVSPDQDTYVSYSIKLSVSAGLLSTNNDTAALQISSSGGAGTWQTVSQISLSNNLTALTTILGINVNLLAGNISNTQILSGWVPKGYYVQIVTSGSVSYMNGQEVIMQ
ncbi:MAG: hypothetical protein EPN39_05055 [Chitinophagaceae bacterium]|nr:MAG: hypothetical protein EPN39_05055 [Chitinophagaceae bacterium]